MWTTLSGEIMFAGQTEGERWTREEVSIFCFYKQSNLLQDPFLFCNRCSHNRIQEMTNARQVDRQNLQQTERRLGEERRQKQSLEAQLNNERKQRKQAEEKATRWAIEPKIEVIDQIDKQDINRSIVFIYFFVELTATSRVNCENKAWKMNASNCDVNWRQLTSWKNRPSSRTEITNRRLVHSIAVLPIYKSIWIFFQFFTCSCVNSKQSFGRANHAKAPKY